ncbi:MAG: M48 family metalloprotease [Gemmatimonadetes bacterium]|nr:M48 family metalloprotease [Gemmatimonadota bacterium]
MRPIASVARLGVAVLALAGCAISTQREIELGTDYSRQVNAQLPMVTDPEAVRYINVLGDSIARIADDRNLDWRFFIVDSPDVNAFAIPGGFVYVNRGLIERTTQMNQLAGVLGHEIGHVVRRHSVKQMQKGQGLTMGVLLGCILTPICTNGGDAAVGIAGNLAMASFSRSDEAESDREGIRYVMRAGIDPRGIPQMFRILIKERNDHPSGASTPGSARTPWRRSACGRPSRRSPSSAKGSWTGSRATRHATSSSSSASPSSRPRRRARASGTPSRRTREVALVRGRQRQTCAGSRRPARAAPICGGVGGLRP